MICKCTVDSSSALNASVPTYMSSSVHMWCVHVLCVHVSTITSPSALLLGGLEYGTAAATTFLECWIQHSGFSFMICHFLSLLCSFN